MNGQLFAPHHAETIQKIVVGMPGTIEPMSPRARNTTDIAASTQRMGRDGCHGVRGAGSVGDVGAVESMGHRMIGHLVEATLGCD